MGACSSKPKTDEFQEVVKSYPDTFQTESQKMSSDYELQTEAADYKASFMEDRADSQNSVASGCATESVPSCFERLKTHGYLKFVQNGLLELQLKPLARISVGHKVERLVQDRACDAEENPLAFEKPKKFVSSTFKINDDHNGLVFHKIGAHSKTHIQSVFVRKMQDTACEESLTRQDTPTRDEQLMSVSGIQSNVPDGSLKTQSTIHVSQTCESSWPTRHFTTVSDNLSAEEGRDSNSTIILEDHGRCHSENSFVDSALESLGMRFCKGASHVFAVSMGVSDHEDMETAHDIDASLNDYDNTLVVLDRESLVLNQIESSVANEHPANFSELSDRSSQITFIAKQQGMDMNQRVLSGFSYNDSDEVMDMDQILDKLASEFERQENLSCHLSSSD